MTAEQVYAILTKRINNVSGGGNGGFTEEQIKAIVDEELARQLITADAQESMDTLEEIAAWIQQHPKDAADMNKQISENTDAIENNATAIENNTAAITINANAIATLQGEVSANSETIDEHTSAITTLQNSVSANTNDIAQNSSSIETINNKISELEPRVEGNEKNIDNILNNTEKISNKNSGFAAGADARVSDGGAVGRGAYASAGGAVGMFTYTDAGGAVGRNTTSNDGGAVGRNAKTGDGFAGGYNAKTIDSSDNGIDAIQLGTGTNNNDKTLKVYDYQMMDADGKVPEERLTSVIEKINAVDNKVDSKADETEVSQFQQKIEGLQYDLEAETGARQQADNDILDVISTHETEFEEYKTETQVSLDNLDNKVQNIRELKSAYSYATRPTSINFPPTGNSVLKQFQISTSTTVGKPDYPAGHILHFTWDNVWEEENYDAQLFIPVYNKSYGSTGYHMQYRMAGGSDGWANKTISKWHTLLDESDLQNIKAQTVSASGADGAELMEWADGNPDGEDRCGYFVALTGRKIRIAKADDDLRKVSVVSGNYSFLGNDYTDFWHGKYKKDVYGRRITRDVVHPAVTDDEGNIISEEYTSTEYVLNDDYDENMEYIPRSERKEWDAVICYGQVVVRDDGTCMPDGFCRPNNEGKATYADDGFYVMERVDEGNILIKI